MKQLPPSPLGSPPGSSYWNDWFEKLRHIVNASGISVAWGNIDFTNSNITSIAVRLHNTLQGLQGGASGDYNHLTTTQLTTVDSIVKNRGSLFVSYPSVAAMSGHRVVRLLNGQLVYANSTNKLDANLVLGISTNGSAAGGTVLVQTAGPFVEPSWTWTSDLPVFCGVNGALTQTPPTVGFDLVIGVATSATQIIIGAKTPFVLA